MDWKEDPRSNLWIFPRGMERNGQAGSNSLKWVSKYGSVITSAYDICTTDGMNEKGLVANLLWLAESEYPARDGPETGALGRRLDAVRAGTTSPPWTKRSKRWRRTTSTWRPT